MDEEFSVDDELTECPNCSKKFDRQKFEDDGYEFNEQYPKCPACQAKEQEMIESEVCEHCDSQAKYMTDGLYLCSYHQNLYQDESSAE